MSDQHPNGGNDPDRGHGQQGPVQEPSSTGAAGPSGPAEPSGQDGPGRPAGPSRPAGPGNEQPAPGRRPGGHPSAGYPPPGHAGGYPPAAQPGGYPPPAYPGGYPPPGYAGGYPPASYPGAYPPAHPGAYPPPGYPGGYPPASYPGGYPTPQQSQQQWGPPAPPLQRGPAHLREMPSFPHPEPRQYHQMLRTWNYAWWKPVVGIVLLFVGMILVAPLVLMPVLMAGVAIEGGPFWESFEKAASFEAVGPAALLYLNLTLGSMILVCWFVMRVLHRMRPRWLTSVLPKMRWKFFFICVGLSVVALVAQVVVSMLLPGSQEADVSQELNEFTRTTAILGVIVLLTTPLQAAGEEYVFRGYLMQAVGSLFPPQLSVYAKWVALIVTATLFAVAHGVQNFPLFFDRFMFGLIAGWLVIRTGGLEAGIAMHILNNFLAFGFALMFSDLTETLNVSEVGWGNIPLTLTQAGTYAVLVVVVAKKMRLQTRTNPPVQTTPEPVAEQPVPVPSGR